MRLLRLFWIILLAGGLFWLGEKLGPRHVGADVYRITEEALPSPRLPPGEGAVSGRQLLINGQRLQAELRRVTRPPREAMDEIMARNGLTLDTATQASPAEPESDDPLALVTSLRRQWQRPYRQGGEGWELLARFYGADPSMPDDRLLSAFVGGGPGAGSLGGGFVVLALGDAQGSDLWTLRLGEDLDLLRLLGSGETDVPGFDLPEAARYPGSRRIFCLAEDSPAAVAYLIAYRSRAAVSVRRQYYQQRLIQAGLHPLRSPEDRARHGLLQYARPGLEYSIYLDNDPQVPGEGIDLIQLRLTGATKPHVQ